MRSLPHVTIIILNWNGRSYLEACLNAISGLNYPDYNVHLVDNNSSDDSLPFVRENFPWVTIQQNRRNLGYAAGNNRALRDLKSDFAVLVNPDIVVSPAWLAELIKPMLADPAIAVAGCKLYFPGEKQIQHAGGFIHGPRAMPDHRRLGQSNQDQDDQLEDVDYVTGAAIALRREALESIGLFDEGFFMYFEEVDLCARARLAGYRVVYVPQATAVHDESAFAVRGSPAYLERFHSGRWRYLLKHFSEETILTQTIPQEQQWLPGLAQDERQAVNRAYRTTLAAFHEIMQTRSMQNHTPIGREGHMAIFNALYQLRRHAYQNVEFQQKLTEMRKSAQLNLQPFHSNIPLLGPFIAWLRACWSAVAARPNASSFIAQQNAFNEAIIQKMEDLQTRLPLPQADWLQKDEQLGMVHQAHKEVENELDQMKRRARAIKERLDRLQERAGQEPTQN